MYSHSPVMPNQALDGLNIQPHGTYLDATYGRGGHSRAILKRLTSGTLVVMDKDPQAIADAHKLAAEQPNMLVIHSDFRCLDDWLVAHNMQLHGALFDLGLSSPQLDDPQRGFSFGQSAPLDMRMDSSTGLSAAKWLDQVSESELARVLRDYGEERHARRIAAAICKARPIHTTTQLAQLVASAQPGRNASRHKHPATRTFQAIRIAVNQELESLELALEALKKVMRKGARLVVISFHSLEDRLVKRFITGHSGTRHHSSIPTMEWLEKPLLKAIVRHFPNQLEIQANRRARSAVMRVAEFVG